MKCKMVITVLMLLMLIACSDTVDTNREPDFQASFLPYLDDEENEEALLAIVDDNMTKEEREMFNLPNEWEVYRIKLETNTNFIDENGTKITKEQFENHDYKFDVWTKESFNPEWSKVLTEEGASQLIIDQHIRVYSAIQIQLVQMTDDEYVALDYANKKGEYTLHIYLGKEFLNTNDIQEQVREHIDLNKSKIKRVSFSEKASERKEQLLEIKKYPIFLLYDHEKLIIKTSDLEDIWNYMVHENE